MKNVLRISYNDFCYVGVYLRVLPFSYFYMIFIHILDIIQQNV